MQTVIAEQPLTMALLLGAIAAVAFYGWLQTGKREALGAALVFLLLIPILWYVSLQWVTDREQIRDAITATAEAVKANDFEAAIAVIDPRQRDVVDAARADLSRFRFSEARVNKFRSISLVEGSDPPEAEADLSVAAVVSDRRGQISDFRVLRRVILRFRKSDDGRWYVHEYNHLPVIGESDGYSPNPQLTP